MSCSTDVTATGAAGIRLYVAKNSDPTQILRPAMPGTLVLRNANGVTFPSLEFNDIPADLADDPAAQYRFAIWAGNVWVHAADARTFLPNPVSPTGYFAPQPGDLLEPRIQTVWPHDLQGNFAPVDRAPLVNVAVDLFAQGTLNSVPPDFQPIYGPLLLMAEGNNVIDSVGIKPQKITYTVRGQTYPRWVFNDVPVRPGQQYNFLARVSTDLKKLSQFTTIWTHAPDARTYLPSPQPPPPCVP